MPRENRKHVSARTAKRSSRSRNKCSSSDERPVPGLAMRRTGVVSVVAPCFMGATISEGYMAVMYTRVHIRNSRFDNALDCVITTGARARRPGGGIRGEGREKP